MSKQLINIRNKNQNKTEIGFGSNGLTVETGAVDPTVEIVVAKKGSLYLCSTNGKTYQKQSDDIDLNWIEILNSTSGTPVDSVNGQTGDVVLDKSDVGLSNVDNTSDANKPISSATQTALNNKEDVGVAAGLVSDHESALNPHPQYATDTDLSNGLSTKENTGVAAGLISAHESTLNPHPQYATDLDLSNGLATKENTGVAAGLVSAHESALDPHTQYQKESEKGAAGGYASLDGSGKVPVSQLPSAVMTYEGVWNANTNSPTLADGVGDAGMIYRVNVAGTQDLGSGSQTFNIGDYVVYNGSIWQQSDTTDSVASVNGQTGVVTLDTDDVSEGTTNKYFSASLAKAAAVADSITDGVVDVAPSQNAVFDALALKADDLAVVHKTGAETIGGVKTFDDGLISEEEVLLDSSVNPYASVRTKNLSGATKELVIASGDSATDISGDVVLATGSATNTAPNPMSIQGLTITHLGTGRSVNLSSVEILVDNTNITNPASPNFALRGSSGQRMVIRVNSATTVNDVVSAFPSSGLTGTYTVTGSGLTTFINEVQFFAGAKGPGEVVLDTSYQARLESPNLVLGESNAPYGQVAITSADVSGSQNSDTIFLITGRVKGTGNSGGISIRSTDMEGSGGSGSTFIRTGSINGSIISGSTTISTGAANQYSTGGTGALSLNSGNVSGTSGNSGAVNAVSGQILSGSGTSGQAVCISGANNVSGQSGGTGQAVLRSGDMSGTNSGATGQVFVRSGNKTNAGATGDTGAMNISTGNNNGAGSSGAINLTTGTSVNGNSGWVNITTGVPSGSGTRGQISLTSSLLVINSGTFVTSGNSIQFFNTANTVMSQIRANPTATGGVTLNLPQSNGTNGDVMTNDGGGNLSFTSKIDVPHQYQSTNGVTINLSSTSPRIQNVGSGGLATDMILPDTSTIQPNTTFKILNKSGDVLTVKNFGGTTVYAMPALTIAEITWNGGAWNGHSYTMVANFNV